MFFSRNLKQNCFSVYVQYQKENRIYTQFIFHKSINGNKCKKQVERTGFIFANVLKKIIHFHPALISYLYSIKYRQKKTKKFKNCITETIISRLKGLLSSLFHRKKATFFCQKAKI